MKEIWKPIEGYENNYEVSNLGRVRNSKTGNLLKTHYKIDYTRKQDSKYVRVSLRNGEKNHSVPVHRLVAIAFIPNPYGKPQVNHKDNIKENNYAWNLEWVTQSENTQHAYDNGFRDTPRGMQHGRAKLTDDDIRNIRAKYKTGKYTHRKLALEYGVNYSQIRKIVNYENWISVI